MIRKICIKVLLIFSPFIVLSQSKLNKDRNSILKMCGCFEIEFKFSETFNYSEDENYVPSKNYRSFALEAAIPIINDKKKISIQHLLIVGYGSDKAVIKHWRQDWIFENRDFYEYASNNRWNYKKKKSSDVKGQVLIENNDNILIAEEKGYNTYKKVSEKKCSFAFNWWKENSKKWSSVRAVWRNIYEKNKDLNLKERVNKMKLYEYLFFTDDYDTTESHENLINSFVID